MCIIYKLIELTSRKLMEYSFLSVYTLGVACLVIPNQDPEEQTKVTKMKCIGSFHILTVHRPK